MFTPGSTIANALTYFIVRTAVSQLAETRIISDITIHNLTVHAINTHFATVTEDSQSATAPVTNVKQINLQ